LRTSTAPYRRLLKRAFLGPGSPETVAFQRDILCPAETTKTRPPIFLPGQLERVTGTTGHQSLSAEIASMLAAEYKHAPTIAYHVRDAILYRGSVYARNMRYFIANAGSFQDNSHPQHYSHAALATTAVGHQFFGHWLRDDCLQYAIAAKYARPFCVQIELTPHMKQYAAYFDQDWTGTSHAIVDHLVMFQDFSQNSLKRSRYEQLASRIADVYPTNSPRDKLIYLRRGSSGIARIIADEVLLIDTLVQRGFEVLDTMSDLATILRTLRAAKLVVSIEGSNINHFNFCAAQNCALIVLQPPDRFAAFHRHWAECVGVRFGFVVGKKRGQYYTFSATEILKTVDLALNGIV
jgi:hypothetical protein